MPSLAWLGHPLCACCGEEGTRRSNRKLARRVSVGRNGSCPFAAGDWACLAGFCVVAVAVTALFVCIGRALLRVALRDGPLVQSTRACTCSAGEQNVAHMQAFRVWYRPCTAGLEECFCDAGGVVWVNAWFTSQQKAACPHSPVLVACGCLVWH
jgi:hypothetical protein